jgi:rhodanese-related sulfurtransferase
MDVVSTLRAMLALSLFLLGLLLGVAGCAPHIGRDELEAELRAGTAPPILDVRSRGEYEAGHVPGAVNIPFYSVWARSDELPRREGEVLVVYCEHGPRAGLARAGLWMAGAGEVRFLEGHMTAWKKEKRPMEVVVSPGEGR